MDPMRNIPINGFGVGGLVVDISPTRRTPAQLSVADNLRIQDGELATIPAPTNSLTFTKTPVYAHPFYLTDDSGGHVIVYDDETISFFDSTGAETNITPAPSPTNGSHWMGVQINDIFILTNGIDTPWQITQQGIGGPMVPLVNWPTNYRARLFANYKGYVVAAGITVDGTEMRSLVKWSHPVSPGDTSLFWDHTDPTLLAGENVLAVEGRNINAIQSLRDNLMIYFDQATWRMSFVGGEYVMAFAKVFTDDGAVGPFAMADYDGTAIVVGFHDIYATDGFNKRSLSDGKLTRSFYRQLKIDGGLRMAYYPERREMFITYKSNESLTEFDLALIYNVDADAFTTMRIPGPTGTGGVTQFYMGPKFTSTDTDYDAAGAAGWTYDNSTERTYNSIREEDDDIEFYMLSGQERQLKIMDGQLVTVHEPSLVYAEVDRVDMSVLFESTGDKIKYLSRMFPQAQGSGALQMSVGVSMLPAGGMEWKSWYTHQMATGWAVGARAAGRYIGFRVRMPTGNTEMFTLSGFDAELMVPDGGRR
jgi:hypothetical protein